MWEALKYVSSGFTLCAFIVATVVFYLNHRIKEERKRIEAAPAEDRASLVAKTLEVFHVDTAGLSRQQQFDIAMRQINGRIERFRIIATLVVVLALVAAGLSAYAIAVERNLRNRAQKNLQVQISTPITSYRCPIRCLAGPSTLKRLHSDNLHHSRTDHVAVITT